MSDRAAPGWIRGLTPSLIVAAALAGCQAMPPRVDAVPAARPQAAFNARIAALGAIDEWTLRGRSAVSSAGKGWSGTVHWRQQGDAMDLRFIAPLGAGTVRLAGRPGAVRVQDSDGTDFITADPDALLESMIGAPLPVTALRWWVLGLPHPDGGGFTVQLDTAGRPVRLVQAGWTVEYDRYTGFPGGVIAARLVARHADLRLRLAIEDWRVADDRG